MAVGVVLASCDQLPAGPPEEADLVALLAEHGLRARWAPWGQTVGDELVVLRATWDYPQRREEFLAWCAQLPRLANPLPVVRHNTDKRYLAELQAAGVPVIPTTVHEVGVALDAPYDEFVIKPVIGAGSRGAGRFSCQTLAAAQAHLCSLHEQGVPALVQPYQQAVDREGETALVYLDGEYSHAFTKKAMLHGGAVDTGDDLYAAEKLDRAEPDRAQRDVADVALAAAAAHTGVDVADLLYARVDVVRGSADEPVVLELELTEPSLGFEFGGEPARRRFATAVAALAQT